MNKPLIISVSQELVSRCKSFNLREYVDIACKLGRLDLIEFHPVSRQAKFTHGIYEVDSAGRMTLIHSHFDDSDY